MYFQFNYNLSLLVTTMGIDVIGVWIWIHLSSADNNALRRTHGVRVTDVKTNYSGVQYWSVISKLANSGNRLSITERSVTRGNSKQRHNRTMKGDGEQYYSNEYEAVSAREAFRFSVEANIRSLICTSREPVRDYDSRATC